MKKNNVLRDLINEGKPTIGTHVHTVWPGIAEVIGYSGTMDYVEFTSQYAPYDLFSLDNFARAIELFDHMTSMIKVDQEPRTYITEKATGSRAIASNLHLCSETGQSCAGTLSLSPSRRLGSP